MVMAARRKAGLIPEEEPEAEEGEAESGGGETETV
jgi:hypothetical protein